MLVKHGIDIRMVEIGAVVALVNFQCAIGNMSLDTVRASAVLFPAVIAGALLGFAIATRIPERVFTRIALALAAAGGVKLLV